MTVLGSLVQRRLPNFVTRIHVEFAGGAEEPQNKIGLATLCHCSQEALVILVQLHRRYPIDIRF